MPFTGICRHIGLCVTHHSLALPITPSGVRPRVQRPVWTRSRVVVNFDHICNIDSTFLACRRGESKEPSRHPPTAKAEGSPAAPTALAYGSTGAVATARSYAFLTGDDAVFTAYEGLPDGTATRLLIHTTDAGGTSRTASVDAVQAGERAIEVACGPFGAPAP